MQEDVKRRVKDMVAAGAHARQGLIMLRQKFPTSLATARKFFTSRKLSETGVGRKVASSGFEG